MRNVFRGLTAALTVLGSVGGTRAVAQQVVEVQVQPPQIQLRVGERRSVFAQAFAAGNNPVLDATFRWSSSDTNVVRVETDAASPDIGNLVGVGSGGAIVTAQVGPVRGQIGVTVTGAAPVAPIAQAAALPDSVLPAATAGTLLRGVVRIDAQRFAAAPSCGSGAFVGRGLVVTSYQTIRGADRLTVTPEGGATLQDVRVAGYSVANDIAILSVVSERDTMPLGSSVASDEYAWAVSYAGCQAGAATTRLRIASWENRPAGSLRHTASLPEAAHGAALVNQAGALLGVVIGDRTIAAPFSRVQTTLSDARSNLAAQRLQAADEVGRAENHLFGGFTVRSDVTGASARVTPLEPWQWPTLAREGSLPLTFAGPTGRYQVDLMVVGTVRATTQTRVTPGVMAQVVLAPPAPVVAQQPAAAQPAAPAPTPAAPQPQPQPEVRRGGGGGAVVPVVLLLAGGGGAAAYFLTKKKDDGGDGGGGGSTTTGSITVSVPNP